MMGLSVNYLAIFIAGIVSLAIGFVWYSPALFGEPWMKAMGYSKEHIQKVKRHMIPMYFVSFILTLVMAVLLSYVMSLSLSVLGYTPLTTGLMMAFFVWLGFVIPVQASDVLFGTTKNWELFYINAGYQLVSLMAMGTILAII